jgi:hypothetical protein
MQRSGKIVRHPSMPSLRFRSVELFVALVTFAVLSAPLRAQLQTFHISGTIRTPNDSILPGANVTFDGAGATKTVSANNAGFYEADLPVGLYTMTAQSPTQRQLQKYQRPLFRVAASTSLTLNITLDLAEPNCDPVMSVSGHALTLDEYRNACGGWDFIPIPSSENIPFQLFIRYGGRRLSEGGYIYSDRKLPDGKETLVFVAYNLFTLRAERVVYDAQHRILKATGNVIVMPEQGTTHRADSMSFRMENGQATLLQ